MAIAKPPISEPFASDPTTQADSDLFEAPSFMVPGYTAPGGNPEIPALGHFNWLFWWNMQAGRYHQSRGFADWDASEDQYVAPACVFEDGVAWILVGTATTGLAPSDDPFNWARFGDVSRPEFGDGSDGDIDVGTSDVIAITDGDRQYNNLTIESGGVLHVDAPFKIRVRGALYIQSGGILRFGHLTELAGGAASGGGSGGDGGIGSNSYVTGSVGGGASGGRGGINTSGLDTDGLAWRVGRNGALLGYYRLGGNGGAGGTGGSAGGSASASTVFPDAVINLTLALLAGGMGTHRFPGNEPTIQVTSTPFLLMGGGGGGGGGGPSSGAPPDDAHEGGGGGAGGSVGIVIAKRVLTEADGAFLAPGGAGGNSANYAGGGGGGGGYIGVVCEQYDGATQTAATCCPGGGAGSGGLGQSVAAAAGATGRIDVKVL
jgi:hypothetical protein